MKFWNDFSVQKKKEYLNSIFSLLILLTLSIIFFLHLAQNLFSDKIKYLSILNNSFILKIDLLLIITIIKNFLLSFYRVLQKPIKHLIYALIFFICFSSLLSYYYIFEIINLNNILLIFIISDLIGIIYLLYHFKRYFKISFEISLLRIHYKFSWVLIF